MFDFQKEVVLNSLEGVEKIGNDYRIDGMLYKKAYMGPVFKTEYVKGDNAKLEINVGNAANKKVMQFVLELGLDNDYRGDFTSVYSYFRKPIVVTLAPGSNAETVAKAFKKAGFVDYKLYDVYTAESKNKPEGVNPGANDIVLVMSDSYITVRKAELIDVVCNDAGCTETIEEPKVLATLDSKDEETKVFTYTENVAEFGTYNYMIHNLRLPTHANIRFASQAEVEMPVKGGMYTQYTFEYTVPRRLGGLSVAGQKNWSTTTHTFFVEENAVNDKNQDFETILSGIEIKSVSRADGHENENLSTELPVEAPATILE
jgi:hypothetical protein